MTIIKGFSDNRFDPKDSIDSEVAKILGEQGFVLVSVLKDGSLEYGLHSVFLENGVFDKDKGGYVGDYKIVPAEFVLKNDSGKYSDKHAVYVKPKK
jgi:hypothetical protein